jgi:hypothetical protein
MDDYTAAWNDDRRRAGWFYFSWLGGLVVIAVGAGFARSLLGDSQTVIQFLVPVYVIGFFITSYRKNRFSCPRCGNLFFRGRFWANAFARKCMHCGLPKWNRIAEA